MLSPLSSLRLFGRCWPPLPAAAAAAAAVTVGHGHPRWLHSTQVVQVGRTWESRPVPGSAEHLDPQAWAKRLFELREIDDRAAAVAGQGAGKTPASTAELTPAEPAKVLMVRRMLPWRESTYYEKCLLYKLGMDKDTPMRQWLPLPNAPSVADDLRKVQHLLQVVPLSMPDGVPSNEADLDNCYLTECGELRLRRRTGAAAEVRPERHAEVAADAARRRVHSMPLYHGRRWRAGQLFSEFYASHYCYQHGQDKSEYRYSGLWRRDVAARQSLARRFNPDGTKRPNLTSEADHSAFPWRNY